MSGFSDRLSVKNFKYIPKADMANFLQTHKDILMNKEDAWLVVNTLGSHLGQINKVISGHGKGQSVKGL